ncbi:MAG: chemotaxis-specific protein-glutamate methyltransferase CheB [Granulosicoccus sp.]
MNTKRILVVDDSYFMQELISNVVADNAQLEVVGKAANGQIALDMVGDVLPDLITLDIIMPEMDGLQTLVELRKRWPDIRVIMVSSGTGSGADAALDALALGADDYVAKPGSGGGISSSLKQLSADLLPKIMALCDLDEQGAAKENPMPLSMAKKIVKFRVNDVSSDSIGILAIGVSTGGPEALARVLPQLPGDLRVPVVIVQHMPAEFTNKLAQRLDGGTTLKVKEGQSGDKLRGGTIYIAPGDFHMVLERIGDDVVITLNKTPPENSCRPAVDVLFRSVAEIYGAQSLAVIMTGMGSDGVKGAEILAKVGSKILVQDQESSVVWGMPRLVVEAGFASEIVPLDKFADTIMRYLVTKKRSVQSSINPQIQPVRNTVQTDRIVSQGKMS